MNEPIKPALDGASILSLTEEACDRLQAARHQKVVHEVLMRECYWFAAPERSRSVLSTFKPPTAPPHDGELLSQSFAFEMCGDLPTVILDTFMPESQKWAGREPGPMVPVAQRADIKAKAAEGDIQIFKAISASNFYPECGKTFNPDLAIGTVAMWIDRKKSGVYHCQGVPIRELEINLGADGQVDDRFVVRWTKWKHLKKLIGNKQPYPRAQKKIDDGLRKNKNGDCCFVRGYWRDASEEAGQVVWRYVEMIDDELIFTNTVKGEGSCKLIVGRLGAGPEWAWATGPMMKALPDFRTYDELSRKKIVSVDMHLMPPSSYPDDSISHLENGIEAGMVYPMRPGSEAAIKNIYTPPPMDPAIFFLGDLEARIKRGFYLDWPMQSGKTPPTATQWLDEMTMAQRRIGTPGRLFWAEFAAGIFTRFARLLTDDGLIEKVKTSAGAEVSLMPYNPAQRAADQQDVAQFTRFAQIGGAAFPEEWKVLTDGKGTLTALADLMGVTRTWKLRPQDQIQGALQNIAKLMGGAQPGAPDAGAGEAATQAPLQMGGQPMPQPKFDFQSRTYGGAAQG